MYQSGLLEGRKAKKGKKEGREGGRDGRWKEGRGRKLKLD